MKTFKALADVEQAGLALAVKNGVQSLMDAYGEDFDADEVGGVVLLDRDTIDDAHELFGRTWWRGCTSGSRTTSLPGAT